MNSSLSLAEVLPSCLDTDLYYCCILENKPKQNPPSLSLRRPTALPPALPSHCSSYWFSTFRNVYFLLITISFCLSKICCFLHQCTGVGRFWFCSGALGQSKQQQWQLRPLQNLDSFFSTKTKMDRNLALFSAFYTLFFKVCLGVH